MRLRTPKTKHLVSLKQHLLESTDDNVRLADCRPRSLPSGHVQKSLLTKFRDVGVITLNRPDARNAVNGDVQTALKQQSINWSPTRTSGLEFYCEHRRSRTSSVLCRCRSQGNQRGSEQMNSEPPAADSVVSSTASARSQSSSQLTDLRPLVVASWSSRLISLLQPSVQHLGSQK